MISCTVGVTISRRHKTILFAFHCVVGVVGVGGEDREDDGDDGVDSWVPGCYDIIVERQDAISLAKHPPKLPG